MKDMIFKGIKINSVAYDKAMIFIAEIQNKAHFETWYQALDQAEIKRFKEFKFQVDAHRFAARRCLAKYLLKIFTEIDDKKVQFDADHYGKPIIHNFKTSFNWSHSRNMIAFACSDFCKIGVDIECIDQNFDFSEIWQSVKTVSRIERNHENFYKLWTAREALGKCSGEGISPKIFNSKILYLDERSGSLKLNDQHFTLSQLKKFNSIISVVTYDH